MPTALSNLTTLYSQEGLRFDSEQNVWVNQHNESIFISSNGKKWIEESLFMKFKEKLRALWDWLNDQLFSRIYSKNQYFSYLEKPVIRLYNEIYKDLKSRVETLTQYELYIGRITAQRNPVSPIESEHEVYQVVHRAALAIWKRKNFSILSGHPEYEYARIQPSVNFLMNRNPL